MKHFDTLRIHVILVVILVISGLISYRLFILSYLKHSIYAHTAEAQNGNVSDVLVRGNIYLQDPKSDTNPLYVVATNKKFPTLYAIPSKIVKDKIDELASALSQILLLDKANVVTSLQSGSGLKVLARKISDEQVSKIQQLNNSGLTVRYEMDRLYPGDSLAAGVVGFFGYNSQGKSGQYGIESYFDDELSGRDSGSQSSKTKTSLSGLIKGYFSSGSGIAAKFDTSRPTDVVLTIDKNVQSMIEDELESLLKKWHAAGGTIIVQEPTTGKILAMADRPTFDPNNYSASTPSTYINHGVQDVFEPGSSFKPLTMAAGLDLGKVTPTTTFTDPGEIDIAGHKIHNFDNLSHGTVTMTTVLEKSLNTGAAWVEEQIGQSNFLNYVINFGFGQKSGIDLPGEVGGNVGNLYSGRQINFVTASFGQGIAVTPLQLINAYSAVANGGKLMKPYIVDHVIREGGQAEYTKPEVVSIPISEKTSDKLKQMLVSVVDNGFDKARIKGYDIAGKTGTAQIPDANGGYQEGVFIHDFMGFAPASNPKFVVLIKMDKPQGITFAADSLSPTFREVAQYLINYYNIPPTR